MLSTEREQDPGDGFAAIARGLQNQTSQIATLDRIGLLAQDTIQGCDHAGITLLDRRGRITTVGATDEVVGAADVRQYELGQGPLVDVLEQQNAVVSPDLANDRRWPKWGSWVDDKLGVKSLLCFQLFTTARSYGALNMYSDRLDGFDLHDRTAGQALAAHAAVAMASSDESEHLNIAVVNRTIVGQAEGILMERYNLDADQAFAMLVRVSQNENRRITIVSQELIETRRTPGGKPRT